MEVGEGYMAICPQRTRFFFFLFPCFLLFYICRHRVHNLFIEHAVYFWLLVVFDFKEKDSYRKHMNLILNYIIKLATSKLINRKRFALYNFQQIYNYQVS